MYAHKQQGKGLFAFLAGSVMALVAIAGVLFMINSNNSRDFKQPELKNDQTRGSSRPDVLSPKAPSIPGTAANQPPAAEPLPPARPLPAVPGEKPAVEPKTKPVEPVAIEPASVPAKAETVKPKPTKPAPTAKAAPKQPEEPLDESTIKPSAEQILNSGNIEKARAAAIREEREKRARERAAQLDKEKQQAQTNTKQPETVKKVEADKTKTAADTKGGRVTVQAGAYNNRQAAEAQRAKIALLGVTSQVVEVENNGKTMYRVQVNRLDNRRAEQVNKTLQDNGINTITRKQ